MLHAEMKAPAIAVWALGLTQILGYGSLYYSFTILAPDMAAGLGVSREWVFGALSIALFLGSLLAPTAGKMADRHGAGTVMSVGSLAASVALVACGLAPERYSFAIALIAIELAACFVLYSTAFVAIVQIGPAGAKRSITHLTLIAGFASTLFWPLTTLLHETLDWRQICFVFAAANLLICMPIHAWIGNMGRLRRGLPAPADALAPALPEGAPAAVPGRMIFWLMIAGFAVQGFVLSSVLLHMVPLLDVMGLGTAGVAAATLFGPAQVASRLINMVLGGRLRQSILAVIATGALAVALLTLLLSSPAAAGIAIFVVIFGLGSGLASIIGGTLPLEVFGRESYGHYVGWMSAARQFTSAFAPFAFALMMSGMTPPGAVGALMAVACAGTVVFALVAWVSVAARRT